MYYVFSVIGSKNNGGGFSSKATVCIHQNTNRYIRNICDTKELPL